MKRILPILVGLALLVGVGLVHGLWTDRWQRSEALAQAEASLATLPDDLGPWQGRPYEQDPQALAMAGATSHYSRTFLDPVTGERVLVILLAGKPARMAVHRPEHCYQSAGYEQIGGALQARVDVSGLPTAEFQTALFRREESNGPNQLRIFWSFNAGEGWEVPSTPRLHFARRPVLYKLYVLRNVTGASYRWNDDPCTRLLGELLPLLDRMLTDDARG